MSSTVRSISLCLYLVASVVLLFFTKQGLAHAALLIACDVLPLCIVFAGGIASVFLEFVRASLSCYEYLGAYPVLHCGFVLIPCTSMSLMLLLMSSLFVSLRALPVEAPIVFFSVFYAHKGGFSSVLCSLFWSSFGLVSLLQNTTSSGRPMAAHLAGDGLDTICVVPPRAG